MFGTIINDRAGPSEAAYSHWLLSFLSVVSWSTSSSKAWKQLSYGNLAEGQRHVHWHILYHPFPSFLHPKNMKIKKPTPMPTARSEPGSCGYIHFIIRSRINACCKHVLIAAIIRFTCSTDSNEVLSNQFVFFHKRREEAKDKGKRSLQST